VADFLFIDGLELDFFNPRRLVCFIAILQGAIFVALLASRYFKYKKTADLWLARRIFASLRLCAFALNKISKTFQIIKIALQIVI
jgi:hypothetical protein